MKNPLTLFLSIIIAITASAGNDNSPRPYEIRANNFTELRVMDGFNVIYKSCPDSAGIVKFTATPAIAPEVMVTPDEKKRRLTVQFSSSGSKTTGLPTLYIYSDSLSRIENDSDSTVTVRNLKPMEKFSARLEGNGTLNVEGIEAVMVNATKFTGNGTLSISGKCDIAKISNTGTGYINAGDLDAGEVKCSLWGTGTVLCKPLKRLSIKGMSATVIYRGDPEVKSKMWGGKVIKDAPAE